MRNRMPRRFKTSRETLLGQGEGQEEESEHRRPRATRSNSQNSGLSWRPTQRRRRSASSSSKVGRRRGLFARLESTDDVLQQDEDSRKTKKKTATEEASLDEFFQSASAPLPSVTNDMTSEAGSSATKGNIDSSRTVATAPPKRTVGLRRASFSDLFKKKKKNKANKDKNNKKKSKNDENTKRSKTHAVFAQLQIPDHQSTTGDAEEHELNVTYVREPRVTVPVSQATTPNDECLRAAMAAMPPPPSSSNVMLVPPARALSSPA